MAAEELRELCRELRLTPAELRGLVTRAHAIHASQVNAEGLDAQLDYLEKTLGRIFATRLLQRLGNGDEV